MGGCLGGKVAKMKYQHTSPWPDMEKTHYGLSSALDKFVTTLNCISKKLKVTTSQDWRILGLKLCIYGIFNDSF